MDAMNSDAYLPVTLVINQFSMQELAKMGKRLQLLSVLPPIKLVKQVPFFPVQFYGISDTSYVERKTLQEATLTLLEALDKLGVRATYQIVRGSNPSQLSAEIGIVIRTMAEFARWFALLETSMEAYTATALVDC